MYGAAEEGEEVSTMNNVPRSVNVTRGPGGAPLSNRAGVKDILSE